MTTANIEAKRREVALFLQDFKAIIKHKKPYLNSRTKNIETLVELGLTYTDQWNIILSLEVDDYVSGPDPDRDRPGFVWVFGKYIEPIDLYIKLKLVEWTPKDTNEVVREAKCISFHRSTHPLTFPLK